MANCLLASLKNQLLFTFVTLELQKFFKVPCHSAFPKLYTLLQLYPYVVISAKNIVYQF